VAIVGGGCAGVLVAIHLMRSESAPRRIFIFEPRSNLGAGAAYSTDNQRHLLNAPACGMSAYEDDPAHFVAWLAARALPFNGADFVPRTLYRDYLQDTLRASQRAASAGTELTWIHELVTSLEVAGHSATVLHFGHGDHLRADRVILALGAPAPVALSGLDLSPTFGMIRDPWCPGALDALAAPGDVLVLGTGLTMIDVTMVLTEQNQRRTVHARSRHGLLPAEHASDGFAPWPSFDIGQPATALEALRRLRRMTAEAESGGWSWRNVIAAARNAAPTVWAGLPAGERRRFLRHLGRQWEVSRHRMSPVVATVVDGLRRERRLTVGAGRVISVNNEGSVRHPRLRVVLAGPGGRHEILHVSALIDCTGPGPDPTRDSPLIAGLVADGLARLHPSGVGLDVDSNGDLRGGSTPEVKIHTVGWCRRGAEFETTAVPEIRRQADRLARHLTTVAGRPRPVLQHS
jgi:uncharacterized NAD(P)/FAD-binding protein YdhS